VPCDPVAMRDDDPSFEAEARRRIKQFLQSTGFRTRRKRFHLVSYPRSGNTLVREYFSILQGAPQLSVYEGDVVRSDGAALTRALDRVELVKSHQMPADDGAMIYLVRDGRNATLSFLYMAFLFGGHRASRLSEVYDAIRKLDAAEGSWAEHVARALERATARPSLVVRYEDLVREPAAALAAMARFMGAELSDDVLGECVRRQQLIARYGKNPYNGYLYEPAENSIYDLLKRHRRGDYWRHILDPRTRRYLHESGATELLLRFGYESSADWWRS